MLTEYQYIEEKTPKKKSQEELSVIDHVCLEGAMANEVLFLSPTSLFFKIWLYFFCNNPS
ncbi:hypothetical protein Scep_026924 [Stephania cephalantha]|uniref:Uncharacterized protein n=1 Tax=Stephania cephalantha TaxID=152367 RepID=A0AAP0EL23_9MAGN